MAGSRAAAEDQDFTTGKDGIRRGTVWGSIKAGAGDAANSALKVIGIGDTSKGSVMDTTGKAKKRSAPGIDETQYK